MAIGQASKLALATGQRVSIVGVDGKGRWDPVWAHHPHIAKPTETSDYAVVNGKGCRPYLTYPFTTDTGSNWSGWRARDHRGQIALTPAETELATSLSRGYIVIQPHVKALASRNKIWPFDRYAALIRAVKKKFDVQFLQPIVEHEVILVGAEPMPRLSAREVVAVVGAARAYVGPEGGLHHAAAVTGTPAVVIFGGAFNPEATGYPEHENLAAETCCGSWKPCAHCREWMTALSVTTVADALVRTLARPRPKINRDLLRPLGDPALVDGRSRMEA